MEFTSQPGGLHCPLQQTKQVSQPSITMDFQKIRKKTKQLTPSPRSSSHDQPGGRSNRTPPRAQVSSSQPIVNRFLGTISSIPCQPGHSPSQIITCITYSPSIPVRETGLPCTQTPQGNTIRRSEEVPRAVKLTKNKPRKSMKVKQKIKNKNKLN